MEQTLDKKYTDVSFYWEFFVHQFETNDIFVGLLVLSVMGSVAFIVRGIPAKIWALIVNQFTVVMKVHSEDPLYEYLKIYLSNLSYAKKRCRRVTLSSVLVGRSDENVVSSRGIQKKDDDEYYTLTPSDGSHWFPFRNNIIFYQREIDDTKGQGMRKETISIRYIGRSKKLLDKLIEDIMNLKESEKTTFSIFTTRWGNWNKISDKIKRPLSTIHIEKNQKKYIMDDIKWFYDSEEWYKERGIPYRRGYLFKGSPGTGKTSIIKAIASELDMNLCICNLSSVDDDNDLISLVSSPCPNSIIVLEDVDACFASEDRIAKSKAVKEDGGDVEGVTLSGLLNVIDGVVSPDRQIFIMTTNHPEKLDAALLRRGRTDVELEFGYIGEELVEDMFRAFFPEKGRYAKRVAKEITKDGDVCPADIQGKFFEYAKDPEGFIKTVLPKKKK